MKGEGGTYIAGELIHRYANTRKKYQMDRREKERERTKG